MREGSTYCEAKDATKDSSDYYEEAATEKEKHHEFSLKRYSGIPKYGKRDTDDVEICGEVENKSTNVKHRRFGFAIF